MADNEMFGYALLKGYASAGSFKDMYQRISDECPGCECSHPIPEMVEYSYSGKWNGPHGEMYPRLVFDDDTIISMDYEHSRGDGNKSSDWYLTTGKGFVGIRIHSTKNEDVLAALGADLATTERFLSLVKIMGDCLDAKIALFNNILCFDPPRMRMFWIQEDIDDLVTEGSVGPRLRSIFLKNGISLADYAYLEKHEKGSVERFLYNDDRVYVLDNSRPSRISVKDVTAEMRYKDIEYIIETLKHPTWIFYLSNAIATEIGRSTYTRWATARTALDDRGIAMSNLTHPGDEDMYEHRVLVYKEAMYPVLRSQLLD